MQNILERYLQDIEAAQGGEGARNSQDDAAPAPPTRGELAGPHLCNLGPVRSGPCKDQNSLQGEFLTDNEGHGPEQSLLNSNSALSGDHVPIGNRSANMAEATVQERKLRWVETPAKSNCLQHDFPAVSHPVVDHLLKCISLFDGRPGLGVREEEDEYAGPMHFLLAEGRAFEPARLKPGIRRGQPRECFQNALNLAHRHPDLFYCEGFGLKSVIIDHAWCVDQHGRVVDPTWGDEPARAYWGVPLNTEFVSFAVREQGCHGIFEYGIGRSILMRRSTPIEYWHAPGIERGRDLHLRCLAITHRSNRMAGPSV
jgi:hypothetical protein